MSVDPASSSGSQPGPAPAPRSRLGLWLPPLIALVTVLFVLLLQARTTGTGEQKIVRKSLEPVMGSAAHLIIVPGELMRGSADEAVAAAFNAMRRLEKLINPYDATSDLSRINAAKPGETVAVDPLTWQAVLEALRYRDLSGGAFNPAIGGLMKLYQWHKTDIKQLPAPQALKELVAAAAADNLILEREGMRIGRRRADTILDLGGIGQGMGVDLAISALRERGVQNAIVEIGGELRVLGKAPAQQAGETERPWTAGIRNPRGDGIIEEIAVRSNIGISTSGDYEKFFEINGKRYSHILDPRTGLPVSGGIISATIIAPDSCTRADALATCACVLGEAKFRELLALFPDVGAYLINEKKELIRIPAARDAEKEPDVDADEPIQTEPAKKAGEANAPAGR